MVCDRVRCSLHAACSTTSWVHCVCAAFPLGTACTQATRDRAQATQDRAQLAAVMACNDQGLVYNRATNACAKAMGDVTIVETHDQLAAATSNGTGMFWVNSSHNDRIYFVPREGLGKVLQVSGKMRNLTRVPVPTFGNGNEGGFQTGNGNWDSDHLLESYTVADAWEGDREVKLGRSIPELRAGDRCLVIVLSVRGGNAPAAGNYEFVDVESLSSSGKTIALKNPLESDYPWSSLSGHVIRFQKVPQYITARFTGTLRGPRWDGLYGGVFAVMARTAINVNAGANIDLARSGYRGGWSRNRHGSAGEGFSGWSLNERNNHVAADWMDNNGGGGGGRACSWSMSGAWNGDAVAGGGGGGGHGRVGNPTRSNTSNCNNFRGRSNRFLSDYDSCKQAQGGREMGTTDMADKMFFGGGGGPRGGEWNCNTQATGGGGGGIIIMMAPTVTIDGQLDARGLNGWHQRYCHDAGGSAGGAGGSIFIKANTVRMSSAALLRATGGGGYSAGAWCNQNAAGGTGAVGRIRVVRIPINTQLSSQLVHPTVHNPPA